MQSREIISTSRSLLRVTMFVSLILFICACEEDEGTPAQSSEANILSFQFEEFTPPVVGIINLEEFTVQAIVPAGTDRTSLIPTIVVSEGASIGPESGTANVFIQDMTYVVTAEDGTKQEWVIIVDE